MTTDDDLEGAIGSDCQLLGVQLTRRDHGAVNAEAIGLGTEREVRRLAAYAAYAVLAIPADTSGSIVIVRIIRPHLRGGMADRIENRKVGVCVFDLRFERYARQAASVPPAVGQIQFRGRDFGPR